MIRGFLLRSHSDIVDTGREWLHFRHKHNNIALRAALADRIPNRQVLLGVPFKFVAQSFALNSLSNVRRWQILNNHGEDCFVNWLPLRQHLLQVLMRFQLFRLRDALHELLGHMLEVKLDEGLHDKLDKKFFGVRVRRTFHNFLLTLLVVKLAPKEALQHIWIHAGELFCDPWRD